MSAETVENVENTETLQDSILMSVRASCKVSEEDNGFDHELIPLINTYLMMANHELGIGINGFTINGTTQTWADWLGAAEEKLAAVKTWVGMNVLLIFDPPDNASVIKSYEETIQKLGWELASKSWLEGHTQTIYPPEYVEED